MATIRDPSAQDLPIARPAPATARLAVVGPSEAPGKGLEALGAGMEIGAQDLYRAQEKADTIRVEDAWNRYKMSALDLTMGDQGVLKTRGGDAVNGNILQKTTKGMESVRTQILSTLGSDEQRMRFTQRADATDLLTAHQVLSHLDHESREYAKTTMMGSEAAAQAQIEAMPENLSVFAQARDTLMHQADAFLKGQGITDKGAVQAYKDKLSDGLWAKRIDALVYGNPLLADALFRANEKDIHNPELKLQLQGRTREAAMGVSASLEAQKVIDEVRQRPPSEAPATSGTADRYPGAPTDREITESNIASLKRELARKANSPQQIEILQAELASETEKLARAQRVSATDNAFAPSTNGLPHARDVAAQLPVMLQRVEKRANELYGPDQGNPDRAAFIKKMTTEIHSKLAADVQSLNAIQRQATGTLIDAITGMVPTSPQSIAGAGRAGTPGSLITSFSQIQANPTLFSAWQLADPQAKLEMTRLMEHNLRAEDKGDSVLFRQLWNRIHLEPGDPQKIDFYKQITHPEVADRLSVEQIGKLRLEIDRDASPGGRSIQQLIAFQSKKAESYFKNNINFTLQPERAADATNRWTEEVSKRIDSYVANNQLEKVRAMFSADGEESVITGKYLESFVNSTPAAGLAAGASKVRAGTPAVAPVAQPASVDTREKLDAWFKTLPADTATFTGTDGRTYKVPARATPQPAGAPAAPVPEVMNENGKLVGPTAESEPEMPKLVTRTKRTATGGTEGPSWSEIGAATAIGARAVGAAASAAGGAVVSGAVSAAEAVTPGSDAEKSAAIFRDFVKSGQYTAQAAPTIQEAIDSGLLNAKELKIAQRMLKAIKEK